MFRDAESLNKFIADEGVKFVDVRFCDLPGVMQHFTVPVSSFDPSEELAFDGSSIRGFQAIHDSRDPRNVAKTVEAYLASTGIADTVYFGPEAGAWNTGALENNRGYKVRYKGGYFPTPPVDHFADLRAEISLELEAAGLRVERQHHEVGDGVENKIERPEPIDKDLYELAPEGHANVPQVPTSLPAVLHALEEDNEYLQAGGVFTADLIGTWIDFKRTKEIAPTQLRPCPHGFELSDDN